MAKMGRPTVKIDKEMFEKLCFMHCTQEEIAGFFDCSVDTITRWSVRTYNQTFAETYKIKSASGKISLRRLQFKSAEAGNVAMQIWLGKQYLGQRDTVDVGAASYSRLDDMIDEITKQAK